MKPLFLGIFFLFLSHTLLSQTLSGTEEDNQVRKNHIGAIIGIALPSAMVTYGIISLNNNSIRRLDFHTHDALEQNHRLWHTHIDDYMQFTPAVAAYTLKLCKVESSHNLLDMTILYGVSNLLAGGIISTTKAMTARERPDHSNFLSFPSGHTETAFVAAEFLHQEYKNQSIWISIAGYSAATFVGIARVYNNKHWVSDVVAGAGIGILTTKFVYWSYPYLKKALGMNDKPLHSFIVPGYSNGNLCLYLAYTF
jgi:hypothetical protein